MKEKGEEENREIEASLARGSNPRLLYTFLKGNFRRGGDGPRKEGKERAFKR